MKAQVDLTKSYCGGAFHTSRKVEKCLRCGSTTNLEDYEIDDGCRVETVKFCRSCLRRGEMEEDNYDPTPY